METWLTLVIAGALVVDLAVTTALVIKKRREFPSTLGGKLVRTLGVPLVLIGVHAVFGARSVAHGLEYGTLVVAAWLVVTFVIHRVHMGRSSRGN